MSKIEQIKKALKENTELWAKTANKVIEASEALTADVSQKDSLAEESRTA